MSADEYIFLIDITPDIDYYILENNKKDEN